MGGSAFTNPTDPSSSSLLTPRMPAPVYQHTRDHLLSILGTVYAYAACPIEAPEKLDYGDVDILVASPLEPVGPEELSAVLGAKQFKTTFGSQMTHFAIPWPTAEESLKAYTPRLPNETNSTSNPAQAPVAAAAAAFFIQFDLHVCPSLSSFSWELFHQAHGDLWSILGSIIRRFGLTATNAGLHIRIAELEHHNKSLARIKLTSCPTEVLEFLGLNAEQYFTPFPSVDAMLAYAATCRFHDPSRHARDVKEIMEELKSNDRQRAKKRPMFATWLESYLPTHVSDPPGSASQMTRADVVDEAKRTFPSITDDYDVTLRNGVRQLGEAQLWISLRKEVPVDGERRGTVLRGVKREVITDAVADADTDAESPYPEDMTACQRAYAEGRFDEVRAWVLAHWEEIEARQRVWERERELARARAQAQTRNAMPRSPSKSTKDQESQEGGGGAKREEADR